MKLPSLRSRADVTTNIPVRFFAKVPEILYGVFKLIETHHPVFFPLVCFSFSRYYVRKKLLFVVRQHVTTKTVISLKIQQNIDLSQRAALTNVDFW